MLQVLRRGRRWLISVLIILVGGVFVFYLSGSGSGGGAGTGSLVELGDRRYSAADLQRAYQSQEQRFREMLGDDFNRKLVDQYIEESARDGLITRAVLAHEAEKIGLHVGDEEVRRFLRQIFRNENGTFDPETMRNYARQQYGTESRFVSDVRDDLLVGKFQRLVNAAGFISRAEAREALRYRGEEAQIAYVAIDPKTFGEAAEVDEDEITRILADEGEQLQEDYDNQRERFNTPEQIRARHILFRIDPTADAAAKETVQAQAKEILSQIQAGGDFEALAEEFSNDPGSAKNGGSLGFFGRGQMVAPFEEAAFRIEPGAPPELIETEYGFHILRVEEKREAIERSFDEAARELAEERYRQQAGASNARALAEKLSEAVANGETLTDAARAQGLTLERPDWLNHNVEGRIEELGESSAILNEIFTLSDDATSSPRIFSVGDRLVLVERLDLRFPDDETVAEGVDAERERILAEWRKKAQSGWISGARANLIERGVLQIRFDDVPAS